MKKLSFCEKVQIAISDRSDGNMRVYGDDEPAIIANQSILADALGAESIARLRTIYENRQVFTDYKEVTRNNLSEFLHTQPESKITVSDGLVTRLEKVGLLLPLADCIGAVFYHPATKTLGLLHAGRHNLEQHGVEKFVKYLCEEHGCKASELAVYFSPCARNYQIHGLNNQAMIEAAKNQLVSSGVNLDNLEESRIDTVTNPDYPSNSTGDTTERFAILVMLG